MSDGAKVLFLTVVGDGGDASVSLRRKRIGRIFFVNFIHHGANSLLEVLGGNCQLFCVSPHPFGGGCSRLRNGIPAMTADCPSGDMMTKPVTGGGQHRNRVEVATGKVVYFAECAHSCTCAYHRWRPFRRWWWRGGRFSTGEAGVRIVLDHRVRPSCDPLRQRGRDFRTVVGCDDAVLK